MRSGILMRGWRASAVWNPGVDLCRVNNRIDGEMNSRGLNSGKPHPQLFVWKS